MSEHGEATPRPLVDEPSPAPWEYIASTEHHGAYVANSYGGTVCDCYEMSDPSAASVRNGGTSRPIPFADMDANARLIVTAVNAHQPMLEALELARRVLVDHLAEMLFSFCELDGENNPIRSTLDEAEEPDVERAEIALAKIDAAIALARGGES